MEYVTIKRMEKHKETKNKTALLQFMREEIEAERKKNPKKYKITFLLDPVMLIMM